MNSAFTNQILQLAQQEQRGFVRAISEDRHTGQSLVVLHEMRGGNDYWSVAYIDPGLGAYFYDIRDCGTKEEEAWAHYAQQHTRMNVEDLTAELEWFVGENSDPPKRLARFLTHQHAAAFISTLPNHEDGIYYLDGPEVVEHRG